MLGYYEAWAYADEEKASFYRLWDEALAAQNNEQLYKDWDDVEKMEKQMHDDWDDAEKMMKRKKERKESVDTSEEKEKNMNQRRLPKMRQANQLLRSRKNPRQRTVPGRSPTRRVSGHTTRVPRKRSTNGTKTTGKTM